MLVFFFMLYIYVDKKNNLVYNCIVWIIICFDKAESFFDKSQNDLVFMLLWREKKLKKYELNMCRGSILKNVALFSLPLMMSSILQLLFNAADIIVVGRFDGQNAMAAVGATSSLINLLINVFIGYSAGAGVVISRYFGAGDKKGMERAVATCISTALIFGMGLMIVGFMLSKFLLGLMDTPFDVIDGATQYMKIYFLGMPAFMLYNFGSGILRAVGDTKRPLVFLTISGVVNVILNLILVIVFKLGVAGVAIATTTSQIISAVCVLICLIKSTESYRLNLKKLKIHGKEFKLMTQIGLPTGIQGSMFSISNVIIQSAINRFGSSVVAGSTAAANIEGFVYAVLSSIAQGMLTFAGQNYGAKELGRIKKGLFVCMALQVGVVFSISGLVVLFSHSLLSIYSKEEAVIQIGMTKLSIICLTYFICGLNETVVAFLRGLGYSVEPMIISVFAICILRIVYVKTVFNSFGTLVALFVSYPISWLIAFAINGGLAFIVWKKVKKSFEN